MIAQLARLLERPLVVGDNFDFEPRDAIVVLGAPLGPDGALTPVLQERVEVAAALFAAGGAPRIVATGGPSRGSLQTEADAIAAALMAAGILGEAILVETESRSTRENAQFTARKLAPYDAHRIWIVTQPFHSRRAARLFRNAGFDARVWHIADSLEYVDRKRAVRWCAREYAAWARLLLLRT
jgi:uncharacterized SAM-binding protein YcdF (DUF218 family)